MKKIVALLLTFTICLISAFTSFADNGFVNSGPGAGKWEQQADGCWKYKQGDAYVAEKWIDDHGETYLLSDTGRMLTGWQVRGGKFYYFSQSDAEGRPTGAMFRSQDTPDGHTVDAEGALIGEPWFRVNPYEQPCIEISISEQHVYFYLGAAPVLDTPCVTGKVSTGTITPTGDYKLQARIADKILKGKNVDGSEYESHVNYWMPFNYSYGLHDATWRAKFGGEIYKTGGSHGCVNLPLNAAKFIFENSYAGIQVHVHD